MRSKPSYHLYHRSDWPEVGRRAACGEGLLSPLPLRPESAAGWVRETRSEHLTVRWLATRNSFESQLYGFPIWDLHIEAGCDGAGAPPVDFFLLLQEHIDLELDRLLGAPPWGPAYVCSKVVAGEPLHHALCRHGFEQIEQRRLYKTPASQISAGKTAAFDRAIRFTSLAGVALDRYPRQHEQILDICREAFGQKGYSRHFTDPFLVERRPGLDYILAAMRLNFERLPPAGFLVAVDEGVDRVAGFSVFGEKPGLTGATHTQLLSAVHGDFRGRGVYGGLTHLLGHSLPPEAALLNVTHIDNREMQSAYHKSGRIRLADTVIMRRVFLSGKTG